MAQPRVEKAILELIQTHSGSKYFFAERVFCDQRTAQRVLKKLHEDGEIYVKGWDVCYKHYIPVYANAPGIDAKYPRILGNKMHMRRWRERNPDKVMDAIMKRRKERCLERSSRSQL